MSYKRIENDSFVYYSFHWITYLSLNIYENILKFEGQCSNYKW